MVSRKAIFSPAKRILSACVCMALSLFSGVSHAASAADFRTPEYLRNGRAYDWVKAADAYSLGFSGLGVTVGILDDSAFRTHPEFAGKAPYPVLEFEGSNFVSSHGIHAAGSIFAVRDGEGMHGIAWGSSPVSVVGITDTSQNMLAFLDFPVSIVSNSWGTGGVFLTDFVDGAYSDEMMDAVKEDALSLGRLTAERDILLVFAAGNEGQAAPGVPASLPSLVMGSETAGLLIGPYTLDLTPEQRRAVSLNMLSVSAFDPLAESSASLAFTAAFSNMADGATDYTLLAPGVDIYSSIYTTLGLYGNKSGTSMATPIVSGVAALVKEAFPFMGGKELADVLLSTATPVTGNDRQPFLILRRQESDPVTDDPFFTLNIIAPDTLSKNDILDMLNDPARRDEIARTAATYGYGNMVADFIHDAQAALNSTPSDDPSDSDFTFFLLDEDTYNKLFGMGIVNAYKAVHGPGWLDANRLNNEDKRSHGGMDYAMYHVDTKGYSATWSNDIEQVKVGDTLYPGYDFGPSYPGSSAIDDFFGELTALDVGLLKSGEGTLFLAGNNKYLGPTVVAGGNISLGVAGQADGAARLAGDVYVERAGTFSGNGFVRGDLDFKGLLSPGFPSMQGNLTVNGDIAGGGELFSRIWADGRVNMLVGKSAVFLDGTQVTLSDLAGGDGLPASRYRLVESETGALAGTPINDTSVSRQGVTLLHEFRLLSDARGLYAEKFRTSATPGSKALSEGFLAGLTLMNLNADLAAGQGMAEAVQSARRAGIETGMGLGAFGALSAGKLRYNTGSHVDMASFSLMTGLSLGGDLRPGHLTTGVFFEYGNGSYDTYNSFSNAASVHGDGETRLVGGGVLGRMDFINTGPGHFYSEASARAGNVHNEYDSSDLRDASGLKAEYDSSSAYYGFHVGAGYAWDITDAATLDLYGKYFWTRQEGDSVRLSSGDPVTFKDVDSSRLRLGTRLTFAINEYVSPYVGAAWEHEFEGKAKAVTNGYGIEAPGLKGDTGIGELGLSLAPSQTLPLSFDLGVQGYAGNRQGVTGSLQIRFAF